MKATIMALEAQHTALYSWAELVFQGWRALDVLAAGVGGACAMPGEECCFYINTTGKVEESRSPKEKYNHPRKYQTLVLDPHPKQNIPNLGPLLSPLISVVIIRSLSPSFNPWIKSIKLITKFVSQCLETNCRW